ncbi:MAG: hypothetical protein OXE85_01595 [Roseovarius sp.]|nr:hypothetical protein [Roseovarius sp.]
MNKTSRLDAVCANAFGRNWGFKTHVQLSSAKSGQMTRHFGKSYGHGVEPVI